MSARQAARLFKSFVASALAFILVVLSPGLEAYAQAGKSFHSTARVAAPEAGLVRLAPQSLPLSGAPDLVAPGPLSQAAADAAFAAVSGSVAPLLPAQLVAGAVAAPTPTSAASASPAAMPGAARRSPAIDQPPVVKPGLVQAIKRIAAQFFEAPAELVPALAAGSAFGVGPTHTQATHVDVNGKINEAFGSGRASLARGADQADLKPVADPLIAQRIEQAVQALSAADQSVSIKELGSVTVKDVIAQTPLRIVLIESPQARALRYASGEDFQISHVGFGPDHNTPTIYIALNAVQNMTQAALQAVLHNDMIELAARIAAKKAGVAWTEALSRQVQDVALVQVQQFFPNILHYVRAITQGVTADFLDLGIKPSAILPAYLSSDPAEQQRILNRLAALRAQGIPADELSVQLLKKQEEIDSHLDAQTNSQVQGLAFRIDMALRSGRDISALVRDLGDPRVIAQAWQSWHQPAQAVEIPVLDKLPQLRTTLADAIDKVNAEMMSQQTLLHQEEGVIAKLIAKHPLMETWAEMVKELKFQAKEFRLELKGLPPIQGRSPEMQALRQQKADFRDLIKHSLQQADSIKEKLGELSDRVEPLAHLSLAMREWFPEMKGLSVAGDFLWTKEGRSLDMLLIVPGGEAPKRLRSEVLRKIAALKGASAVELSGYAVGEKWLRQSSLDVDRHVVVGRFALMGLSLWGPNLAYFFRKLPNRQLWSSALGQVEDAEAQLKAQDGARARSSLSLALAMALAMGLKIHGHSLAEKLPAIFKALEAALEKSGPMDQESLALQAQNLRSVLTALRDAAEFEEIEKTLARLFDKSHEQNSAGQFGAVALGAASSGFEGRPIYTLSPMQARTWLAQAVRAGKPVETASEDLAAAFARLKGKARYWDWLPEALSHGESVEVGRTNFGRKVKVKVNISEVKDSPELMGLLVESAPDKNAPDTDSYEMFLNGAVFRMDPEVQEVVLGSLIRQLRLAMEGMPLDAARDKASFELEQKLVSDTKKDHEVLEAAVARYKSGIRVETLPDAQTHLGEAMRTAQAVSEYLNAPQRRLGGTILLGCTVASMRPVVEKMAEVFAGNGIKVAIAEGEAIPAEFHHAVREGAYRLGFLVSRETVVRFGHYKGRIPDEEFNEIRAAASAASRDKRLALSSARLQGLVEYRLDIRKAYLASLKERFNVQKIASSDVRLIVDTQASETAALLHALGLPNSAVDIGGDVEGMAGYIHDAPAGEKRLGVFLGSDNPRIHVLDINGKAMQSSDLSLLFTWYLVHHRNYGGKIFRAFTQTRLLDRLAKQSQLSVEEVDPAVWGLSEADTIVLSPWTPYNDLFSQALLAAEIVATTGQSLGQLLENIRKELGVSLDYQKSTVPLPTPFADKMAEKLSKPESEREFKAFLAKSLRLADSELSVQRSHNGFQVSLNSGDWLYLRWTKENIELYAEGSPEKTKALLASGKAFISGSLKELGPSQALRLSFLFASATLGIGIFMLMLSLMNPGTALSLRGLGGLYSAVSRVVGLGFGAVVWLWPNPLRKIMPSWNNPVVFFMSVMFFLEFALYMGVRWITMRSSGPTSAASQGLSSEIARMPELPRQANFGANSWLTLGVLKDGRLAVLKPAFSNISEWLQPFIYEFQAQYLIRTKTFDESNVGFRQGANARGWLFFKFLFMHPHMIFVVWWNLFCAAFPEQAQALTGPVQRLNAKAGPLVGYLRSSSPFLIGLASIFWWASFPVVSAVLATAGLAGGIVSLLLVPNLGLSTHIAPTEGVPLPAELQGRYRARLAQITKVSDGDTIQTSEGTWLRYKGMDASDEHTGDLYRRAKEFNTKMVKGKKVLLVFPQIKEGDSLVAELDVHGRVLSYVYAQDQSGKWVNMTLLLLNKDLATDKKGKPDPDIPFSLDVTATQVRSSFVIKAQSADPAVEVSPIPADQLLPYQTARKTLEANEGFVDPTTQLRLAKSFAGPRGIFLKKRLGSVNLADGSQLFVSGENVRIGRLNLGTLAKLDIEALPAKKGKKDEPGEVFVGNDVTVVDGRFRFLVPPNSKLRILAGTVLSGLRDISVPPGQSMVLRNLPDGALSIETEYRHPAVVLNRLWASFKNGTPLDGLLDLVRFNKLNPAALAQWWKKAPIPAYEPVRSAASLTALSSIGRQKMPAGLHQDFENEVLAKAAGRLSDSQAGRRFLVSKQGKKEEIKQALLAGLERHYETISAIRQQEKLDKLRERLQAMLKTALKASELHEFLEGIFSGFPEVSSIGLDGRPNPEFLEVQKLKQAWNKTFRKLPPRTQGAIASLQREVAALQEIDETRSKELSFYMERAQQRLAGLAGLLIQGPDRFPDAISLVLGGPHLFVQAPKSLELLVVEPGEDGPRAVDASTLKGIRLPAEDVKVVSVGEAWLKRNFKDGMRNRLLSRFLITGTTLWGRDLAAMRSSNIGGRVPEANFLALAKEFLDDSERLSHDAASAPQARDLAYLSHLTLLGAAPGILERIKEADKVTTPRLISQVRIQHHQASEALRKQELRAIVSHAMGPVSAHDYADSGLGGVLIGDVRPQELGRKLLYKISSQEALSWIERLVVQGAPVQDGQSKLDALLNRLKARREWWSWYPERLDAGRFALVGRDMRGRSVEVRVRIAALPQSPGTLAVMAQSEKSRSISDVDRYEIFLNGMLFELDTVAQQSVLTSVVRQLQAVLDGKSLREARDSSQVPAEKISAAIEQYARGVRSDDLPAVTQLPWQDSTWTGPMSLEDSMRLAKSLGDYVTPKGGASKPVLVGYSSLEQKPQAEAAAQVLSARGIAVILAQGPATLEAISHMLKFGAAEMALWYSSDKIKILGKDGQGLGMARSNEIGWLALRSHAVRRLDLKSAQVQGLLEIQPVPELSAAQAPTTAQPVAAPAQAATLYSSASWSAFMVHASITAAFSLILVTAAFFPSALFALPLSSKILMVVRAAMSLKSLIYAGSVFAGLALGAIVSGPRFLWYVGIMYRLQNRLSKGQGTYYGLIPELEKIPRSHLDPKKADFWFPVSTLPDGRIAIREEYFAHLSPTRQMLIYHFAVSYKLFLSPQLVRFGIDMGNEAVIGRFRTAKIAFFVVLMGPVQIFVELAMLWDILMDRLMGRPINALHRTKPEPAQGQPVLPSEIEKDFSARWETVTVIKDDSTVVLMDGTEVRLIGAGKAGKAVPLMSPEARELLEGKEVLLVIPKAQAEGTRRVAGHIYASFGKQSSPQEIKLTRAVHALAARQGAYGYRLPGTAAVDSDKLPLFLTLPMKNSREVSQGWEKTFASSILSLFAAQGFWAVVKLSGIGLSPLAHVAAFAALGLLVLPAAWGFIKLIKGLGRGPIMNHKLVAAALSIGLGFFLVQSTQGPGWAAGSGAQSIGNATSAVLEFVRMPRVKNVYTAAPPEQAAPWRALLPAGSVLVGQARAVLNQNPAIVNADAERAAWETAMMPLKVLDVREPQLLAGYMEKVRLLGADPAVDRSFEAGAKLLALYSRQLMLPTSQQETLLSSLLQASKPGDYDSWVEHALLPVLRKALVAQRIPLGNGSWREVLLRAAAGKLSAVPDTLYYPTNKLAADMNAFISQQGRADAGPMSFAEAVLYAKLYLRVPEGLRPRILSDLVQDSAGAFWAEAEMAKIHRASLLGQMVYAYPESPYLLLPEGMAYVAQTVNLAKEALLVPGLRPVLVGHLGSLLPTGQVRNIQEMMANGRAGNIFKSLTPSQRYMLGRLLADDPELNRYLELKSLFGLRSMARKLQAQGTGLADFQRELDAVLALPGGESLTRITLPDYGDLKSDPWALWRRYYADILIQTVVGMDQEKIPGRFLPDLLPHALIAMHGGKVAGTGSAQDVQKFQKALNRVKPAKIRAALYRLRLSGGEPLTIGLNNRSIPELVMKDLGSEASPDNRKPVGALGFSPIYEDDLKSLMSGTFRVGNGDASDYGEWKAGDKFIVKVGTKAGRKNLFTTTLTSIKRKQIGYLSLDELETCVPSGLWNRVEQMFAAEEDRIEGQYVREELQRQALINALIEDLRQFYPGTDRETWGTLLQFEPYASVKFRSTEGPAPTPSGSRP